MRTARIRLFLIPVTVVALFLGVAATTASAAPVERRHPSGLILVDPGPHQARPASEDQAQAWDEAYKLAVANPDDLGYPWIDKATGTVQQSVASARGKTLGAQRALRATAVPRGTRQVTLSYGKLESIKHDATTLVAAKLPDADAIWKTAPDDEHNRIIITVSRLTDALANALVARYGTTAVAVEVADPLKALAGSRQADTSPFWGGDKISTARGGCTGGFPWQISGQYAMVTAGHCVSTGGYVTTPAQGMGWVTANTEENWQYGYGTTLMSGQTTNRGDVGLIRLNSGQLVGPRIFRGGANSTTTGFVREMWNRSPAAGDHYCTSGATTGEICEWIVEETRIDEYYFNEGGAWARNVNRGDKIFGSCAAAGDSGAPVYTVRPDGGIAAKGIHSGALTTIGCDEWFTDIWDAWYGLPGSLVVY